MRYQQGFSLIKVLIQLALLVLLYFLAMKFYFNRALVDPQTEKFLNEQGVNLFSYKAAIESTRLKVKEVNENLKKQKEDVDKLFDLGK